MTLWPLAVAAAAGGLTTLSPCVLPMLPLVVGASAQRHRHGPLAMAAGMVAAFVTAGMALAWAGEALFSPDALRLAAAALMIVFGAALLSSRLSGKLASAGAPAAGWADRLLRGLDDSRLAGQFLAGALLGLVWTPCSGPTLGAALTLAAERGGGWEAAAIMTAFAAGAATPLLAVGYGARELLIKRRQDVARAAEKLKLLFGALLMIAGTLVASGLDKRIDAALVARMPSWLVDLTTRF